MDAKYEPHLIAPRSLCQSKICSKMGIFLHTLTVYKPVENIGCNYPERLLDFCFDFYRIAITYL